MPKCHWFYRQSEIQYNSFRFRFTEIYFYNFSSKITSGRSSPTMSLMGIGSPVMALPSQTRELDVPPLLEAFDLPDPADTVSP